MLVTYKNCESQATGAAICLSTAWRLDPSARRFVEEPTGGRI